MFPLTACIFRGFIVLCTVTSLLFLITTLRDGVFTYDCSREAREFDPVLLSFAASSSPLLPAEPCTQQVGPSRSHTDYLFVIHSAINNFHRRKILREHARRFKVKVVFALGQSKDGIHRNIRQEAESFADLIIGPFIDEYANLTLKHLFALNWVTVNCPVVDFVVKTDDDIVINFKQVFRLFDEKYPPSSNALISRVGYKIFAGFMLSSIAVTRKPGNKWCTRLDEYAKPFYPDYCSGWAYITTIETIVSVLQELKTINRGLWIDDVFVSGVLREECGAFLEPLNHHFSLDVASLRTWTYTNVSCVWDKLFSNTDNDTELMSSSYSRLETVSPEWTSCRTMDESRGKRLHVTGKPHVSLIHLSAGRF